jgi:hypothetical protein
MALENPNTTLQRFYAMRSNLQEGKIQSYTIGDRTVTLVDMRALDDLITKYENIVASGTAVFADLSGTAHLPPWPEG